MCAWILPLGGGSIAVRRTLQNSVSGHPPPNRFEPHSEQNVFADPSSGWYVRSSSRPSRTRIASERARPLAVPTPPEIFLQLAQWHCDVRSNSPSTSKRTFPHRQRPFMT